MRVTRLTARLLKLSALIGVFIALGAAAASAAPKLVEPSAAPFAVQTAGGKLQPFTIRVSGFQPGQQVFVEQCDGVAITDPHWAPEVDCDVGSSPAPVFTPASGTVEFSKDDLNHRFVPFAGVSPQGSFACFTASAPAGTPHFDTCKIRISTNNTQVTKDQVFLDLALAGHAGATPANSGQSGSGSSGSAPVALIAGGVAVVALLGGGLAVRKRRRSVVHSS